MDKEYKIRKLTRKDRKTFTGLITKLAASLKDEKILDLIKHCYDTKKEEEKKKDKAAQGDMRVWAKLGVELLNNIIETLDVECAVWFADLLSVDIEKYDDLPLDIEFIVIEQLLECEEINAFFERALQLRNVITKLYNKKSN